jgi:hypothetical protein
MSVGKVILSVLSGVGIFLCLAGLVWFGSRHLLFGRVMVFSAFAVTGGFLFAIVHRGMKNGVISYGYRREETPFAFWLYVVLGVICGTVAFGGGIYCLVTP